MLQKIHLAILFFLLCTLGCAPKQDKNHIAPNIIFILIDDLGWSDLPVYGNQFNEAPRITRLAEEGMLFTNAYAAAPVCSPTRGSIMTGQYPARNGIIDFIPGHWRPYEEVIVPSNRTQYLPLEQLTFAEQLKKAGYQTGYFGKWHLGGPNFNPDKQGFDEQVVYNGGGFFKFGSSMQPPQDFPEDKILSEALTDLSIDFIRRHKDTRFFLFLSHYDVHVQLDAQMELINKYLQKPKVEGYPCNAIYAAMVENVDRSMGRIMDEVEQLGLGDNTVIVFFSDNGGLVSRFDKIPLLAKERLTIYEGDILQYVASSNQPLRDEKGTVYEGGIREPFIVRWHGKIPKGTVTSAPVSSIDLYPTFLDLAGLKNDSNHVLDGISLMKLLVNQEELPERNLFWHYPVYHHGVPASAVRKGDFKLVENLVDGSVELFDLAKDIGETTNVSAKYPLVTEELRKVLQEWRTRVDAAMPVPNPGFDPKRRFEWGKRPS